MPANADIVAARLAATFVAQDVSVTGVHILSSLQSEVAGKPIALADAALDVLRSLRVSAVGVDDSDSSVTVFLKKKPTKAARLLLPNKVAGIPVRYDVAKFVTVNPEKPGPPRTPGEFSPRKKVRCGTSISLGNHRAAGTFGALVRDKQGTLFGMTCNHVTGGCNNTPINMPVVSPAVLDVTPATKRITLIGRHARVLPIRQGQPEVLAGEPNFDVALFRIRNKSLVSSDQGPYDTPSTVVDAHGGMRVEKVGRTTGHTKGRIGQKTLENFPYKFSVPISPDKVITFQGICSFDGGYIVRPTSGSRFAQSGDSGSLVVASVDDSLAAVGLLIGDTVHGQAYMLPIRPVLEALDVELVSGHNRGR